MESVRLDEEPVLKTGGCKSLGGSSPSLSAKLALKCSMSYLCKKRFKKMDNFVETLGALGVGGAVTKLTSYLIQRHRDKVKRRKAFGNVFAKVHEVYSILNTLLADTEADRILILKTTNGGGKPKPSGSLYSSVIYEVYENPLESIRKNWQKQKLDAAYINVLLEVDKHDYHWVNVSTMEDGMLKDLYTATGIKKGLAIKLAEKEHEYIYMAVNFTEDVPEDAAFKESMRGGLTVLRRILADEKL